VESLPTGVPAKKGDGIERRRKKGKAACTRRLPLPPPLPSSRPSTPPSLLSSSSLHPPHGDGRERGGGRRRKKGKERQGCVHTQPPSSPSFLPPPTHPSLLSPSSLHPPHGGLPRRGAAEREGGRRSKKEKERQGGVHTHAAYTPFLPFHPPIPPYFPPSQAPSSAHGSLISRRPPFVYIILAASVFRFFPTFLCHRPLGKGGIEGAVSSKEGGAHKAKSSRRHKPKA
jgi:hypothetical protein